MKRKEQIEQAAREYATHDTDTGEMDYHGHFIKEMMFNHNEYIVFMAGAEWADNNPITTKRIEDKTMTREEFKKQIEYPLNHFITNEDVHFWERNHIKATIGRTLRLALQYPNLAQEYLDSLPKATMD